MSVLLLALKTRDGQAFANTCTDPPTYQSHHAPSISFFVAEPFIEYKIAGVLMGVILDNLR